MAKKQTLHFASWESLIEQLVHDLQHSGLMACAPDHTMLNDVFGKLDTLKQILKDYAPGKVHEFLGRAHGIYRPGESYETVVERMKQVPIGRNEFYTVFDMRINDFTAVDPKVEELLGIPPKSFHIQALLGNAGRESLHHPADVHHWVRWGALGYLLISLPYFSFASMENCFVLKFRINTRQSEIPALREAGYVLLEQHSYPYFETGTDGVSRPTYHFDRWSVFDASLADGARPYCSTETKLSTHINALMHLLNAAVVGLPPKYVLLLNERLHTDRNKEIAHSLNEKINQAAGIEARFDEFAVGNYFSKSIRGKLAETLSIWEKRRKDEYYTIESEPRAVQAARTLGLLPLHDWVEKHLLKSAHY